MKRTIKKKTNQEHLRTWQKKPRILLVDDDVCFGKIMESAAQKQGLSLNYVSNVNDLILADQSVYDAAIFDYDLTNITGIQLTAVFGHYMAELPILLVSSYSEIDLKRLPKSIKAFVSKQVGAQEILSAAVKLCNQPLQTSAGLSLAILLIDDDPVFLNLMSRLCSRRSINLQVCDGSEDMGMLLRETNADVIIMDYYLNDSHYGQTGLNVISSAKLAKKPVIFISSSQGCLHEKNNWPRSVVAFINKDDGPDQIIDEAIKYVQK